MMQITNEAVYVFNLIACHLEGRRLDCIDSDIYYFFYPHRRKQQLKELVSVMCQKGDGAQLSLFPFPGLQEDVERMLVSKAQQTPVLSLPNYYRTLFAYHTYRGDYKKGTCVLHELMCFIECVHFIIKVRM